MFPPSYFVILLLILLLFNKKLASYFYPFILLSTLFGIIINIFLIFSKQFRTLFYKHFVHSISNHINEKYKIYFYLMVITIKLLIINIYPFNMSKKAIIILSYLVLLYAFLFISISNGYHNQDN
jgi:hypothetical protein